MKRTSITDNAAYPQFCYAASRNDEIFANFKRYDVYRRVLEHTSVEIGEEYLKKVLEPSRLQFTTNEWKDFQLNDTVGNAEVHPYRLNGNELSISPSTLRYVKVLSDIINWFSIDKIKTVAEIGIGYGGQCRLLTSHLPLKQYWLFDLPEVLELAERFLDRIDPFEGIRYVNGKHIYNETDYDLVISNYAFSELTRAVQKMYLDKIILRSTAGYITWNSLSRDSLDGYSADELIRLIPNASVRQEEPLTHPNNLIIVWGDRGGGWNSLASCRSLNNSMLRAEHFFFRRA